MSMFEGPESDKVESCAAHVPTARRLQEVAQRVEQLQTAVRAAAVAAGRCPSLVEIVAVTKYFPVSDVVAVAAAGLTNIGENRVQEWSAKAEVLSGAALRDPADSESAAVGDLTWHFIGQLQTNKAAVVAARADLVHSVDRLSLVKALNKGAARHDRQVGCLIQLSLDGQSHRGGVDVDDWRPLANAIAETKNLKLLGVMAVAPKDADPAPAFAQVQQVSEWLTADYPDARAISTGMSGDFEVAIAYGATHVRVGASLLGPRPVVG